MSKSEHLLKHENHGIRESDGQGAQWGQKQRGMIFSGQGAAEEQLLQEAAWDARNPPPPFSVSTMYKTGTVLKAVGEI